MTQLLFRILQAGALNRDAFKVFRKGKRKTLLTLWASSHNIFATRTLRVLSANANHRLVLIVSITGRPGVHRSPDRVEAQCHSDVPIVASRSVGRRCSGLLGTCSYSASLSRNTLGWLLSVSPGRRIRQRGLSGGERSRSDSRFLNRWGLS